MSGFSDWKKVEEVQKRSRVAQDLPRGPGVTDNSGPLSGFLEGFANEPGLEDLDLAFRAAARRYGEGVRAARQALGQSQTEFARNTGLTQAKISKIENGTMPDGPTLRSLFRIALVLEEGTRSAAETTREQLAEVSQSANVFGRILPGEEGQAAAEADGQ